MTHHLTDERLGAARDGALSGSDAAAAGRHLAACAECRARLADLAALDAALAGALEHDPGEEYFAAFADRVGARIASGTPAGARAPRSGFAAWWGAPRRLAWAGGALGLVAVAALVVTLARDHGPQELARQATPARELGANAGPPRDESRDDRVLKSPARADAESRPQANAAAPPAPVSTAPARPAPASPAAGVPPVPAATRMFASAPAAAPVATPPPAPVEQRASEGQGGAEAPGLRARDQAAALPKAQGEIIVPTHIEEVRTLPNGEQEIVTRKRQPSPAQTPVPPVAPPLRLPGGFSKPAAAPAAEAPAADLAQLPRYGGVSRPEPGMAVCGRVRDARGRPAVRALVMVAGTGATATAGSDGAFCVDVPDSGGTLSVLAVGYRPYRAHVTAADAATPVAITLAAVDVLAPPAMAARRDAGEYSYMGSEPPSLARRAAIGASAAARQAATAAAWTEAAERWETVALLGSAAGDTEPGFRAAEARVNAWLIGRTDAQRVAARNATQAFLDHAPAGAFRDIALGWSRVLGR